MSTAPIVTLNRRDAQALIRHVVHLGGDCSYIDARRVRGMRGERDASGARHWFVEPPSAIKGGPDLKTRVSK